MRRPPRDDLADLAVYYREKAAAIDTRRRPGYRARIRDRDMWLGLADEIDAYLARDPDVVGTVDPAADHDPLF